MVDLGQLGFFIVTKSVDLFGFKFSGVYAPSFLKAGQTLVLKHSVPNHQGFL